MAGPMALVKFEKFPIIRVHFANVRRGIDAISYSFQNSVNIFAGKFSMTRYFSNFNFGHHRTAQTNLNSANVHRADGYHMESNVEHFLCAVAG